MPKVSRGAPETRRRLQRLRPAGRGDCERHRHDPKELSEQGRRRARRLVQRQRGEPAGPRPAGTVMNAGTQMRGLWVCLGVVSQLACGAPSEQSPSWSPVDAVLAQLGRRVRVQHGERERDDAPLCSRRLRSGGHPASRVSPGLVRVSPNHAAPGSHVYGGRRGSPRDWWIHTSRERVRRGDARRGHPPTGAPPRTGEAVRGRPRQRRDGGLCAGSPPSTRPCAA